MTTTPILDIGLNRSLPASVEAERSILGAILLDDRAFSEASPEYLKPEDFSLDSHRRIYSRMIDLAESSRPIDMITLIEELERHNELQAVGDAGYVSGLVNGVPERPSIKHYVEMMRRATARRHAAKLAESAQRLAEGSQCIHGCAGRNRQRFKGTCRWH